MRYSATQNQTIHITPIPEVVNGRDWSINPLTNQATHIKGNGSTINLKNFNITAGRNYQYSYVIDSISDGYVQISAGGDNSQPQETTSGYKEGTFTATDSTALSIFSNADVVISSVTLKVLNEVDSEETPKTICYDELNNKWTSNRDYIPDVGVSLFTDLFTFKDGKGYVHSDRENRNNFYGVKYDTTIRFPVSSIGIKTYQSIAIHSNKVIGTTQDGISTQLGHVSDLIREDFVTREGIHYANFYRDKFTGLLDGERLKGRYIVVEFEDKCGKKLHIFKTVIKSQMSTPNE